MRLIFVSFLLLYIGFNVWDFGVFFCDWVPLNFDFVTHKEIENQRHPITKGENKIVTKV